MPIFLPKDEALALEMKAAYTSSMIQKSWHDSYAVGDDVYMIGMFANHQGKVRNNPLARFGNISMVASDDSLVEHARNRIHNRPAQYEAHIVDMHSRSGYSGSPVFAYRPYGKRLTPSGAYEIDFDGASHHLLGIHYGSFQEPVKLSDAKLIDTEALRAELGAKASIDVTTGMTCVAPTWKIVELLDGNELTAKRKHAA